MNRDEALAVLGLAAGTSGVVAGQVYMRVRRQLLEANPDHRRGEVRRLDDAFFRLRELDAFAPRLAAYGQARVRIGVDEVTVVVRPADVGIRDGVFPFPDVDRVHVITAFNPGNNRLGRDENFRRQEALVARVTEEGAVWWPAVGGARHAEVSVAVAGLSTAQACALGAEFGQDAVFAWTRADWSIVLCGDASHTRISGWMASTAGRPMREPIEAWKAVTLTRRLRADRELGEADARPASVADGQCAVEPHDRAAGQAGMQVPELDDLVREALREDGITDPAEVDNAIEAAYAFDLQDFGKVIDPVTGETAGSIVDRHGLAGYLVDHANE